MKTYAKQEIIGREDALETLHTLAHDLRTPMCCVAGAAQMAMLAAKEGKSVEKQLQQILQAIGAMNDVLCTVCGAGEGAAFSADVLERELSAVAAPLAQEKGQSLGIDLGALRGIRSDVNSAALLRVLLNLLRNAIQYTPEGGEIVLMGQLRSGLRPGQPQRMLFFVRDNGVGMRPMFLAHLYEPGSRAQETAHLPGKGLGLPIVKRLVTQMGGTIGVRSEWGKGTMFSISIPTQNARL